MARSKLLPTLLVGAVGLWQALTFTPAWNLRLTGSQASKGRSPSLASSSHAQPSEAVADLDHHDGMAPWRSAVCAVALCALVTLSAASRADAKDENRTIPPPGDPDPVALDLRIPQLPEDEERRRRTAVASSIQTESWYTSGEKVFNTNCAVCHPKEKGGGKNYWTNNLYMDREWMDKRGGFDADRIKYSIRYGVGKMGGYAADCGDMVDDFSAACGNKFPISEEKLRDVQDFVMNRAYNNWKD